MRKIASPSCCMPLDSISNITPYHNFFDSPVTWQKVKREIMNSKISSAAGPDLINNRILTFLPDIAIIKLTEAFKLILEDGTFPVKWHEFDISLISEQSKVGFRPTLVGPSLSLPVHLKYLRKSLKEDLKDSLNLIIYYQCHNLVLVGASHVNIVCH